MNEPLSEICEDFTTYNTSDHQKGKKLSLRKGTKVCKGDANARERANVHLKQQIFVLKRESYFQNENVHLKRKCPTKQLW